MAKRYGFYVQVDNIKSVSLSWRNFAIYYVENEITRGSGVDKV